MRKNRNATPPRGKTSNARTPRRHRALMVIVLVLALFFAGRLVQVQLFLGPGLASAAAAERSFTRLLLAPRGDILDADGTVMATSLETYNLILDLNQVPQYTSTDDDGETLGRGAAALAADLGPILDIGVNDLGADLVGDPETSTGRGYYVLARDVTSDVRRQVEDLMIPGFTSETSNVRSYPNGTVGGTLLGWINSAGDGVTGLEAAYQDVLQGTDGQLVIEQGSAGQRIPSAGSDQLDAVPGCDLNLSIDLDLQFRAEQILNDTVQEYGAQWAAVSVVETKTGRLLTLADSGSYDPADPPVEMLGDEDAVLAPSYMAAHEPGSTGKILTVLSALEEGTVDPTTPIDNPYALTINGQTFRDFNEHPDQILTTTGVLAESANTSTIEIGATMSDQTRHEYMELMGWGQSTGLGLPGEATGRIGTAEGWNQDNRTAYTTMFGQSVAVSLLQNTGVLNTIGNQGMHVDPTLVDGWTCDGEVVPAQPPEPTQIVSPESSAQMLGMLESVVTEGTGVDAAVEGYRVAGKTGSAQTADGAGGITATTASFVGVVPAEDPALTIGVVIFKPTSGFFGGTIAAPVFRDVATYALSELGVPPSTEPAVLYPLFPEQGQP